MKKKKKNQKTKIKDIIKVINSLKEEKDIKFVFSYIKIGDTLDEFNSETIMNLKEDLVSNALKMIIDEKVFGNPVGEQLSIDELESVSKLDMFNIFNNNKNKPEA
tara:strand:+ start:365 stop:679 length:315 start_codon:yes stop_codon:yes gene_type:complete